MRRNEILEQIFETLHISEPFYMASYINQNPSDILDKINFEEYIDSFSFDYDIISNTDTLLVTI
jgi:hypothetical protein